MDSLRTKQIDREYFWKNLKGIRPINKVQVKGIEDILDHYDANYYDMTLGGLASYLGQAGIETPNWLPIREYGGMSYFKYLIGKLGIDNLKEAWMFRGWGRVQTTGETGFYRAVGIINAHLGFKRFDSPHALGEWLLGDHDTEAESQYDLIVSFTCCSKGLYTGRKFNDFSGIGEGGGYDFYNARKVINPGQITVARRNPNGHHARMLNQIVHDSKVFYEALRFIE